MTANERPDPVLRVLTNLRPIATSAARDRRVVSRCHDALARQHRQQRSAARFSSVRTRVDLAIATGIVVYGAIAITEALRLALVR